VTWPVTALRCPIVPPVRSPNQTWVSDVTVRLKGIEGMPMAGGGMDQVRIVPVVGSSRPIRPSVGAVNQRSPEVSN